MPDPAPHPTPGPSNAQTFKYATFDQVLDDLSCRFILNLPDEELRSIERVCFQVEQAHWFYEDFVRDVNPNLPSFPLRKFSAELFRSCPMLQHWSQDHEQAFAQFMAYKVRVPVCGAIMLNDKMDKCVLVKGYKSSSGWGFPKGKINQNERECDCAAREVLEETGYDLSAQINESDYFNTIVREQSITLFIVPAVPEDFPFKTRTRKEISKIEWFKLADLPTWKRKREAPGKFYLITPFIGQLKDFIRQRRELKTQSQAKGAETTHHVKTKARNHGVINVHSNIILEQRSSSDESATPTKESSSLSSGNVGPTTPSPERVLFFKPDSILDAKPAAHIDGLEGMDPHLANLLNNLNISANGKTHEVPITNGITTSSSDAERVSTRGVSPSVESVSSNSIYMTASSVGTSSKDSQPGTPAFNPSMTRPTKSSKHIALLDSVVEDIELYTPTDPPQRYPQQDHHKYSHSINGLGRPSSSASLPPHPYPHNLPGQAQLNQHVGYGPPPGHHPSASSINFPSGMNVNPPVHLEAHQYPPQNMLPSNMTSIPPRPLTSQSQVQLYPGAFAPNGHVPPPLLGLQPPPHPSMPSAPVPGTHQSQLLALLSPRSRAVSQPQAPAAHQALRSVSHPTGVFPVRESVYNSYLNGHGPPAGDIPPLSLSSPLTKGADGVSNRYIRREPRTGSNTQLLSILNGTAPAIQEVPAGAVRQSA